MTVITVVVGVIGAVGVVANIIVLLVVAPLRRELTELKQWNIRDGVKLDDIVSQVYRINGNVGRLEQAALDHYREDERRFSNLERAGQAPT